MLGYYQGQQAPGLQNPTLALKAAHHLLLAHGLAMPIIRTNCPDGEAGIVLNQDITQPKTSSATDYAAYRHRDGYLNRWFLDPIFGRQYPIDIVADYVKMGWLPCEKPEYILPGDMEIIAAPIDFIGINYYTRAVVSALSGKEMRPSKISYWKAPAETTTHMEWEIYPDGLYQVLLRIYYNYQPKKIYVTENGASFIDLPNPDGKIHDQRRIDFLRGHFHATHRAIQAGIPVGGFFVWSLMDNFEWACGYSERFGLVHIDYATQKRTPRDSAYWYAEVARTNRLT